MPLTQIARMLRRSSAPWIRYLCLLPYLASVLLPFGMMPAVSAGGTITLVICTAHGPQERSFPSPDEGQQGASSWCPFSLLSAPVLPSAPVQAVRCDGHETVAPPAPAPDVPATSDVATASPRAPPFIL